MWKINNFTQKNSANTKMNCKRMLFVLILDFMKLGKSERYPIAQNNEKHKFRQKNNSIYIDKLW